MPHSSFPYDGLAVVIGAGGGVGAALCARLQATGHFADVIGLSRHSAPPVDLTDEASIEVAALHIGQRNQALRLVIDATGFLHGNGFMPEKSLRHLDPAHMAHAFAINAVGPALLMKHFLPLLPKKGKSVFATLSARVGSIGDNRLGGWHSYRASKAALNQFVRCAAIELARSKPDAICIALHPGTVDTQLSTSFAKTGLDVRPTEQAAAEIIEVIERLNREDSDGFFDHKGAAIPW
ncbi:SDR family oxidoreductase [Azoarcus taiwanensis]|uniref:SDR family NAD(P)-dependent oxidoreductase n=1 Tax=Azoarcus taiwanensis TaxID=666964 RepID=A0A972J7C0_9RHOO|nr:SDR family oxidoreductase [Azoarcus taiwanensis]NMG01614.1 SDR family NAD(P)-dependent oxidoreductase [Azoarcus taiwanensis]